MVAPKCVDFGAGNYLPSITTRVACTKVIAASAEVVDDITTTRNGINGASASITTGVVGILIWNRLLTTDLGVAHLTTVRALDARVYQLSVVEGFGAQFMYLQSRGFGQSRPV